MPNELSHIQQAQHNSQALSCLERSVDDFSDWMTTVAFYKALHLVEAVFANDKTILHGHNHENRENILKRTPKYSNIYKHYRVLLNASIVARYLQERGSDSRYSKFSYYMSKEGVKKDLIDHRLHQIEKTVKGFFV
jgi:hypothetical protein